MIMDSQLMFTPISYTSPAVGTVPGQAFTTSIKSTNSIDWGIFGSNATQGIPNSAAGGGARDIGIGDNPAMKLLVQVGTAFTGTAPTLSVALQGAPDSGTGTEGAYATWWTSPTYAAATIAVAGARLYDMDFPRPPAGLPIPRFVQMFFTVGGTVTGGSIIAGIVLDRFDQPYLPGTNNAVTGGYPPGIVIAN